MNNARQVVSLVFGCMLVLFTIRLMIGLLPRFRPRLRVEGSRMSVKHSGKRYRNIWVCISTCTQFGFRRPLSQDSFRGCGRRRTHLVLRVGCTRPIWRTCKRSNPSMKPTPPSRNKFSVFAPHPAVPYLLLVRRLRTYGNTDAQESIPSRGHACTSRCGAHGGFTAVPAAGLAYLAGYLAGNIHSRRRRDTRAVWLLGRAYFVLALFSAVRLCVCVVALPMVAA